MCTQCVAQAVPAVAVAAGGLRAMAWKAKQRTAKSGLPPVRRPSASGPVTSADGIAPADDAPDGQPVATR